MNNKYSKYFFRFRFLLKYKLAKKYNNSKPIYKILKYIFLDPELDTFSYNQVNSIEIAENLTNFFGISPEKLKYYFDEFDLIQSELRKELFLSVLWRLLFMKRKILFGRNINEYVIVRSLKPNLVIELGIKYGLSSLVIAKALDRNKNEGFPGNLICVDIDPESGLFLSKIDQTIAKFIIEDSIKFLEKSNLSGDIYIISDSMPGSFHIKKELQIALSKNINNLVFQFNSSWGVDVFERHFNQIELIQKTDHPIYAGRNVKLAKFANLNTI